MRFLSFLSLAVTVIPFTAVNAYRGEKIEGQYIVMMRNEMSDDDFSAHTNWATETHVQIEKRNLEKRGPRGFKGRRHGLKNRFHIGKFRAYSGEFDEATVEEIRSRPEVLLVEQDTKVELDGLTSQAGAPWGLGRISNTARGSTTYYYDTTAGAGVTVYVIDTGILTTHTQFGGRARAGYNAITNEASTDLNGHGTHVAGTVGGSTYGVAKAATLVGVKVLNRSGSGSNSQVLAGVQWVVDDARAKGITKKAVANMSLGSGYSAALNTAVRNAYNAGITFVVAAGNDNRNAANYSPASESTAITVGATTSTDARASYSNYGSSVDIFAPGSSILSAWIGSNSATNTISGTSMASPHVAGVAAYLIALEGLSTPAAVTNRILSLAQTGKVTSAGSGSPNRLLYNGSGR